MLRLKYGFITGSGLPAEDDPEYAKALELEEALDPVPARRREGERKGGRAYRRYKARIKNLKLRKKLRLPNEPRTRAEAGAFSQLHLSHSSRLRKAQKQMTNRAFRHNKTDEPVRKGNYYKRGAISFV